MEDENFETVKLTQQPSRLYTIPDGYKLLIFDTMIVAVPDNTELILVEKVKRTDESLT